MAQLAIKGHKTRGKEVIEILEMLGYINLHNYVADCDSLCFYGGKSTNGIYYDWVNDCFADENVTVFALEEFLEKYPYKVGDKVIVKTLPEYPKTIKFMEWFDNSIYYSFDKETWFEADGIQLYKEKETMEERKYADLRLDVDQDDKLATEATINGNKITPPENYLIGKITQVDNGLLVEFVKKQPQYPKTYAECCRIIVAKQDRHYYYTKKDKEQDYPNEIRILDQLDHLRMLIICRDAYWKITGDWRPDWESSAIKYTIRYQNNNILKRTNEYINSILSFPTEEMRDAFFENFKDLIEQCKELL